MATETSTETYKGVEGVLSIGGNPFAYVKAEVNIDRDVVNVPRGGKYSQLALPGMVKPSIKVSYGLVDPDPLIDALDDGTNTVSSSDEALHTAITGDGSEKNVTSSLTNPSTPMTIKLKLISTDGYSAGNVVILGTDVNDVPISETINFPAAANASTTLYYYGKQTFKTVTNIIVPAVLGSNDTATVYGMGQRSVTIGEPALFTAVFKLLKSSGQYVQMTCTNCWMKNLPLTLTSNAEPVIIEQELVVRDPDADITFVANSA